MTLKEILHSNINKHVVQNIVNQFSSNQLTDYKISNLYKNDLTYTITNNIINYKQEVEFNINGNIFKDLNIFSSYGFEDVTKILSNVNDGMIELSDEFREDIFNTLQMKTNSDNINVNFDTHFKHMILKSSSISNDKKKKMINILDKTNIPIDVTFTINNLESIFTINIREIISFLGKYLKQHFENFDIDGFGTNGNHSIFKNILTYEDTKDKNIILREMGNWINNDDENEIIKTSIKFVEVLLKSLINGIIPTDTTVGYIKGCICISINFQQLCNNKGGVNLDLNDSILIK